MPDVQPFAVAPERAIAALATKLAIPSESWADLWQGMHAAAFVVGAAVALIGPTSQQVALDRLRPLAWLAVPVGVALLLLLLQSGSRTPSEFIYFQF